MSIFGGAYKDTEEWEDISRILTALQNGAPMPIVRTQIAEWRELGQALRLLNPPGGSGSGFGVGEYGNVPWDVTVVGSGAYTTLSNGVHVPNYATVGWGKEINETFLIPLNDLISRIAALEAAIP